MAHTTKVLASALALATALSACGGGGSKKANPTADLAAARAAVLTKADLPGYDSTPHEKSDDLPDSAKTAFNQCVKAEASPLDNVTGEQQADSDDFDKDNSRPLPRAFMATNPETRRLLDRTGYVNGHVVRYLNSDPPRWRYVTSQAFIFRTAAGARVFLASLGNRLGARADRRKAVDLGDAGWSYVSASSEPGAVVAWLFGRVVGVVACQEMAGRRALSLALARKQQRRIATARR